MVNALKMFNIPLCNIQLGYGQVGLDSVVNTVVSW